ncbi:alpha/beta fold hydrolase [Domibacillus sp. DTU_2020_1001157_1_SI_ALB_TIR_016]|uniref:alpha/beta fold hydrolase n=1 Tax=Domibacillus sp. DTU_2020_1001157_1_SI_ALB_TIR_016 TaxID=3077789 RepID=UPI0028E59425|nr:alpha/beta fold hydrolase [Domibacillus sp. DTU_2020_1001157_1_SI_ALB_TIR_016]WNS78027.1 alpha/beta fold hydrolase [Domibacillus sp. DTU_2020_1001157_1_SI_ALB_TIR_016]
MPIAGTTYYKEIGQGEPLILIHGVGLDHSMWEKQVEALSSQFRVIVYDMVGHGGSEHPPAPYSISQFAKQLSDLMEHLNIKKSHIVGFSMGGMTAQAFALAYPEKVKTLTIMSAVANRTNVQRAAILSRVQELKAKGPSATIEPAIQRWFSKAFQEQNQRIVQQIRQRLQHNNPESYLAAYTLFATADEELWTNFHEINVPVFIITGEEDVGSNPQMSEQMHEKLSQSKLTIVPGMKHMLPVEGAALVNEALSSFIHSQAAVK